VLALLLAALYSIPGLRLAFSGEFVAQDDARQHVFWMQRFEDPSLFPDDLIADYFEYVAPPGYAAIYRAAANVGLPPLLFNKLLPSVLIVTSAGLVFGFILAIFPVPPAAFAGSVILTQMLWMKDDVPSATSRAFAYPLLFGLLWQLARRPWAERRAADGCAIVALALLPAWVYPPAALLAVGVVALDALRGGSTVDRERWRRHLAVAAISLLAVASVLLLPTLDAPFGPWYDASTVRAMPEYRPGGRSPYFVGPGWEFWLTGHRAGLVTVVEPPIALAGVVLPLLLLRPAIFPLGREIRRGAELLGFVLAIGAGLFIAAHLTFPRLYFPGRYSQLALRLVLAPAAAITFALVLDRLLEGRPRAALGRGLRVAAIGLLFIGGLLLLSYPLRTAHYPVAAYHRGETPALYRFLRAQPASTVVASLSPLADDVPTFAARTVLVSPHYGLPFHRDYYDRFKARAIDLLAAQYTADPERLAAALVRWNVDYWLLDTGFQSPSYLARSWVTQYQPACDQARALLERGSRPAISTLERCSVVEDPRYRLLDAQCMLAALSAS
jgi:hypothetical protein